MENINLDPFLDYMFSGSSNNLMITAGAQYVDAAFAIYTCSTVDLLMCMFTLSFLSFRQIL